MGVGLSFKAATRMAGMGLTYALRYVRRSRGPVVVEEVGSWH